MPFIQTETTKDFIKAVKSLVDSRQHGRLKDIATRLDYNYSALNQIMNGGRNVPDHVYSRFSELYNNVQEKVQSVINAEERLLLEQSVLNLTATQKINATSIDRLVASNDRLICLLSEALNLGKPGKSLEVQPETDTAKGIRDQPLDLALDKKYSRQKIKGSSQKGDR
jgi:Ribonuclease G/E